MNEVLIKYYNARKTHDLALSELEQRVQKIVDVIKKVFKKRNVWWSFKYYESSGNDCPLPENVTDGQFPIYISSDCDSGSYNYAQSFPIEFFDMTSEEIETDIKNEISINLEEEKKEKDRKKKKDEEYRLKKEELKKSASKKLTKEEKLVLGLK